jgi:hypothetical protein
MLLRSLIDELRQFSSADGFGLLHLELGVPSKFSGWQTALVRTVQGLVCWRLIGQVVIAAVVGLRAVQVASFHRGVVGVPTNHLGLRLHR